MGGLCNSKARMIDINNVRHFPHRPQRFRLGWVPILAPVIKSIANQQT
jgi:hypothetical protein